MALEFIAKDDKSPDGNSPTVFVEKETGDLVLQGFKLDSAVQAEVLTVGNVPDHEFVVRMPKRMVDAIRKACDVSDGDEPR
jgi:hypothetical protein